jgi:membrane-bound lytic murein transglycosylase B
MKMPIWASLIMLLCAFPQANAKSPAPSAKTVEQRSIAAHLEKRLGKKYAESILADPRLVLDKSLFRKSPGRHIPHDYDYVFSESSKIRGRKFLEENNDAFSIEEKRFGVPREVIDGILDIETQWGKSLGRRPVLTTLYTLAVMRPNRIQPGWPEKQLIAFLAIYKQLGIDPFTIKGSPTGAFGYPQFEPTSYSVWAIRCRNGNGPPDLFNNADTICSIGNYLHRAGWGTTERSHQKALYAYNHDGFYIAAILDYADWLSGIEQKKPRYRHIHSAEIQEAALK